MKKNNSIEKLVEEGKITTADKVEPNYVPLSEVAKKYREHPIEFYHLPKPENYDGKRLDQTKITDEYGQSSESNGWHKKFVKNWIKQIEDYCSSVGILPEDLIKCHLKAQNGMKKLKGRMSKESKLKEVVKAVDGINDGLLWSERYRKNKLGLD